MWDSIIPITLKGKRNLKLRNEKIKYALRDVYNQLKGQNIRITLDAEIMPIVGYYYKVTIIFYIFLYFLKKTIATFNYTMPENYKY